MCRHPRFGRARSSMLALWGVVALVAAIASVPRQASADAQSCTGASFVFGGMEVDGNLTIETPGLRDWFGASGSAFLQSSSVPCGVAYPDATFNPLQLKPITIHNMVRDDCNAQGNKDTSVFGSTSDKNNSCLVVGLGPWQCKTGDVPQKNDLTEA